MTIKAPESEELQRLIKGLVSDAVANKPPSPGEVEAIPEAEAKGASNLLEPNKDSYMRNPHGAKHKWVVLQLSQVTLLLRPRFAYDKG